MYEEQLARIKELELQASNIDLQYMGVSSLTLRALSMFGYQKILHLNMSRNQIDNETILTLSKIKMDNLLFLDIHWNRFDHRALKYFIRTKLPLLQGLYMSGNDIGLEGFKTLLLCPWNLLELGLSNAIFSDQVSTNKMQTEMAPLIRARFPNLRVPFF